MNLTRKRLGTAACVALLALAALLLAPAAEASRGSLPAVLAPALEAPSTPDQVLEAELSDPPERLRLFEDLRLPERPLEMVEARKTASGVFTLGIQLNIWQTGGLDQNRSGPSFQGLWTDPVTGISYARNRWYDARTASWLSEDPKGAVDSPNLYAFVAWGPHLFGDPMGKDRSATREARRRVPEARRAALRREFRSLSAWLKIQDWLDSLVFDFRRTHGRWPGAEDEIFEDFDSNITVYGDRTWVTAEGIEPDYSEFIVASIIAGGWVAGTAAVTEGATTGQVIRVVVGSVADDAAGELVGVNPSSGKALFNFIESKGARAVANGDVIATAQTSRSLRTSQMAAGGEIESYKALLINGEVGLRRPGHANAPGADHITARLDPLSDEWTIYVNDAKSSSQGSFPSPKTSIPTTWGEGVRDAIAPGTLDLDNPMMEQAIRDAYEAGRVYPRQINVDYSPAGQGSITVLDEMP